ncbi:MAG TPA: HAMP domain-containing sensor histidine kinase, partial [Acidisarcina sp.]
GIPASVRGRLGEPFFTTKGQRGTGLGLWVTQTILERYGGHLQLCSSTAPSRHGTVFSVFLPTNLRPQPVLMNASGGGPAGRAMGISSATNWDRASHRMRVNE